MTMTTTAKTIFESDTIRLVEDSGVISCYFPIALKDNFREALPSAKWDKYANCWKVTTRVRTRVLSWAKAVEEAAQLAKQIEEVELQEEDYKKLEKFVEELRATLERKKNDYAKAIIETDNIKRLKEEAEQIKKLLEAEEEKILAAEEIRAQAKKALAQERAKIDGILSKIIDLDKLKGVVFATFAKYHNAVGATARSMFDRAQSEYFDAQEQLAKAGYRLAAIDYLCDANFNRPDRDGVKFMPPNAWYQLSKIEIDDETV
jgi:chromosome segregation ATPase